MLDLAYLVESFGVEINLDAPSGAVKAVDLVATVVDLDPAYFPALSSELALQFHLGLPFGLWLVAFEIAVRQCRACSEAQQQGGKQVSVFHDFPFR